MTGTRNRNKHRILSALVIVCGLFYIFMYQFTLPFKADLFLYGMLAGLIAMSVSDKKIIVSRQAILFILVAASAFVGCLYTSMRWEGLREAILFTFFAGLALMSLANPAFIRSFTKWIYIASVVVVLSSILHFLAPFWFNGVMSRVLRGNAYEQLMWSFSVDHAFPGLSAYTPNTTFSAAIVFGWSFLNIANRNEKPIVKNKLVNIVLLAISMFSIIICSKRGIFVATIAALLVLMFYLYRRRNFFLKLVGAVVLSCAVLAILYGTNEYVHAFLNRFIGGNFLTGRDTIYSSLLADFKYCNYLIGRGTAATYKIAATGAHNIYLQILYDHGILFSIPYFALLIYNYFLAFRKKCPISIFVQTVFLVYGLSGNPFYSNVFMMIYIYYVLYALRMPAAASD